MSRYVALLLSLTALIQHLDVTAAWQSNSGLQNDLLAAWSWAALGMDPDSFLEPFTNDTDEWHDESVALTDDVSRDRTDGGPASTPDLTPRRKRQAAHAEQSPLSLQPNSTGIHKQPRDFQKYQYINVQSGIMVPVLRIELRICRIKLFEIHNGTFFILFLGLLSNSRLNDLFHVYSRSREDSLMYTLEDYVSLIGVDGPACVHRMLCEMGSSPALRQEGGLFWELLDLTIRHILTAAYQEATNFIDKRSGRAGADSGGAGNGRADSGGGGDARDGRADSGGSGDAGDGRADSGGSGGDGRPDSGGAGNGSADSGFGGGGDADDGYSSTVSYLDAVSAGRHGADCAVVFHKCPLSLKSFVNLFRQ